MYSVVLMAALTTGGATPDFGHRHCCGWSGGHGCYGCYGGYGYGCYGGCYGGGYYGGYGCWGTGCYGGCIGLYGCYGGYSCYGGYGCSGYSPLYVAPQQQRPRVPAGEQAPPPRKEKDKNGDTNTRARLVVRLPADAQLFIDDNLMKSSSTQRTFVTPLLRPGQTYFYDLKAELVRDGKTVSQTRRVLLRPGDAIEASFNEMERPAATVAADDR
jgi:uncharacterized protein (TIGR03000 family)